MSKEHAAILAVISHLQQEASISVPRQSSLEKAVMELKRAYSVADEDLVSFPGSTVPLPTVYAAGCKSLLPSLAKAGHVEFSDSGGPLAVDNSAMSSASSATNADDAAFERFLEKLRSTTTYFEGLQLDSREYKERLVKARAKFDAKVAGKRSQSNQNGSAVSNTTRTEIPGDIPSQGESATENPSTRTDSGSRNHVKQGKSVTPEMAARAESLKEEGNAHIKKRNYQDAYNSYSRAIQCDSTNAVLYSNRAAALLHLSRFTEAIKDCEVAIEIDPRFIRARERLASTYRHLGMFETEYATLSQASALNPSDDKLRAEVVAASERIATAKRDSSRPSMNIDGASPVGSDIHTIPDNFRASDSTRTDANSDAHGNASRLARNRIRDDGLTRGSQATGTDGRANSGATSTAQGEMPNLGNIFGNMAAAGGSGPGMGIDGLMSAMHTLSGDPAIQRFMNQGPGQSGPMQEMLQGMMQNPEMMQAMMQSVGTMFSGGGGGGTGQGGTRDSGNISGGR